MSSVRVGIHKAWRAQYSRSDGSGAKDEEWALHGVRMPSRGASNWCGVGVTRPCLWVVDG